MIINIIRISSISSSIITISTLLIWLLLHVSSHSDRYHAHMCDLDAQYEIYSDGTNNCMNLYSVRLCDLDA